MQCPRLAILDVGHGNCAILQDTRGVLVIDAGPGSALLEFLLAEGISRVDVVLISHADEDHIGGLVALLHSGLVSVGRVRLNTDSLKGSAIWDDLVFALSECDRAGEISFEPVLAAGMRETFDQGDVHVEVLGPSKYLATKGPGSKDRQGRRINTNSISAVLRLSKGGTPVVVFAGDLDEVGLESLYDSGQEAQAKLLVFPHHGGGVGTHDFGYFVRRLCQLIEPDMVIFSIGRSRHNTPRPEIVLAVRNWSPSVRIACTQLSRHCSAEIPEGKSDHLTNVFARGKEKRLCCAGSLLIDFTPLSVLPLDDSHQRFIDRFGGTALCRQNLV
jgi:beta-lactamase superfamily II metal-dependent hydrolase